MSALFQQVAVLVLHVEVSLDPSQRASKLRTTQKLPSETKTRPSFSPFVNSSSAEWLASLSFFSFFSTGSAILAAETPMCKPLFFFSRLNQLTWMWTAFKTAHKAFHARRRQIETCFSKKDVFKKETKRTCGELNPKPVLLFPETHRSRPSC